MRKRRRTFGFSAVLVGVTGCAIAGAAGIADKISLLKVLKGEECVEGANDSRVEICEPISAVCANECVEELSSHCWKSQNDPPIR